MRSGRGISPRGSGSGPRPTRSTWRSWREWPGSPWTAPLFGSRSKQVAELGALHERRRQHMRWVDAERKRLRLAGPAVRQDIEETIAFFTKRIEDYDQRIAAFVAASVDLKRPVELADARPARQSGGRNRGSAGAERRVVRADTRQPGATDLETPLPTRSRIVIWITTLRSILIVFAQDGCSVGEHRNTAKAVLNPILCGTDCGRARLPLRSAHALLGPLPI